MPDFKHLFENTYYSLLDSKEVAELEEIFLDEPLFQACSSALYNRSYDSKLTRAEIWYIAECFCIELGRRQKLMDTYYPIMLNRLIQTTQALYSGSFVFYPHQGDMQTMIACIDIMLRCSLGEKQSKAISRIVRESMKQFYYQDAMYMISSGGIELSVLRIMQMPVETDLVLTKENYLEPRPWMLGQEAAEEVRPVDEDNEIAQLREYITQLKSELEEKNEQIQMVANKEKGISLGINQAQTALLGLSLANAFGFVYSNKKKELAPLLHSLFGWGEAKIATYLSFPCENNERDELANLFKDLSPRLYATIMNRGELPPEVTPFEEKVTPSDG